MSMPKKKNYGRNSLLKHLNLQLSTNNFSTIKNVYDLSNVDRENPQWVDSTCCGMSREQCGEYGMFCNWNNENQICHAVGAHARLDDNCRNDVFCCGPILPGVELTDTDDGVNPPFETRSLSEQIGPGNVLPGDGQSYISRGWWTDTANWIMRGNRNLDNQYNPVPCAVPPVYDIDTSTFTCQTPLSKVINDGNEIITMADWGHLLCEYNPEVYCQEVDYPCTSLGGLGDINNDGVVNILDLIRIINYILGVVSIEDIYADGVTTPEGCMDVNQDGTINILDLSLIVNNLLVMSTDPGEISVLENVYDILTEGDGLNQSMDFRLQRARHILNRYVAQSNKQEYLSPF